VAGYLLNAGESYRGFIWTPEAGTVILPRPAGVASMQIHDLNDVGHAVGELHGLPVVGSVPFFWDGQDVIQIQMPAGSRNGWAWSLNNLDQVVGQFDAGGRVHAFFWEKGVFTDLTSITGPGTAIPNSIDDRSRIAGSYGQQAFLIEDDGFHLFHQPAPLVSSGCSELSNGGFAAGYGSSFELGDPNNTASGVVWTPGQTQVLSTGIPRTSILFWGINESGRAVGARGHTSYQPLVWQGGAMMELYDLMLPPPPARPAIWYVTKINRSGQIVISASGALRGAVVLSPQWLAGDLTGDCRVTFSDLSILLSHFGSPAGAYPAGDVDGDGDVDLVDLAVVLEQFGE